MRVEGHARESERLQALRTYEVLDTPREKDYDAIVELVAKVCEVPVAFISLIDENRQWFKAEVGLGTHESPLPDSMCARAIESLGFVGSWDTTSRS